MRSTLLISSSIRRQLTRKIANVTTKVSYSKLIKELNVAKVIYTKHKQISLNNKRAIRKICTKNESRMRCGLCTRNNKTTKLMQHPGVVYTNRGRQGRVRYIRTKLELCLPWPWFFLKLASSLAGD